MIGPVVGGALISMDLSSTTLFSIIGLPLIAAAFAVLWLRGGSLQQRNQEAESQQQRAPSARPAAP